MPCSKRCIEMRLWLVRIFHRKNISHFRFCCVQTQCQQRLIGGVSNRCNDYSGTKSMEDGCSLSSFLDWYQQMTALPSYLWLLADGRGRCCEIQQILDNMCQTNHENTNELFQLVWYNEPEWQIVHIKGSQAGISKLRCNFKSLKMYYLSKQCRSLIDTVLIYGVSSIQEVNLIHCDSVYPKLLKSSKKRFY